MCFPVLLPLNQHVVVPVFVLSFLLLAAACAAVTDASVPSVLRLPTGAYGAAAARAALMTATAMPDVTPSVSACIIWVAWENC